MNGLKFASVAGCRYHNGFANRSTILIAMYQTRAPINTHAIRHNIRLVRDLAPLCRIMAVVKADAYGHGAVGLLPVLGECVDGLAVARIAEAQKLRGAGYFGRLLLLMGVSNDAELEAAIHAQLDIVIHDVRHLALLANHHHRASHKTTLWLKLDSGMGRLGFTPSNYVAAFHAVQQLPWCEAVIGMTHLASSEAVDNDKTARQIACYQQNTQMLSLMDHSIANSGGILMWPAARVGWLRPGLMLYGVSPVDGSQQHMDLQPAMKLQAKIIGIKTVESCETVGYNETWRATRDTVVVYVAAGYADGYPLLLRDKQAQAAVNGQRVPIIGRVSMDSLALDCTWLDLTAVQLGDWVELWGDTIGVKEVANWAGTIPYQLLTQLSLRVRREYI
jgi:alanine racemase